MYLFPTLNPRVQGCVQKGKLECRGLEWATYHRQRRAQACSVFTWLTWGSEPRDLTTDGQSHEGKKLELSTGVWFDRQSRALKRKDPHLRDKVRVNRHLRHLRPMNSQVSPGQPGPSQQPL